MVYEGGKERLRKLLLMDGKSTWYAHRINESYVGVVACLNGVGSMPLLCYRRFFTKGSRKMIATVPPVKDGKLKRAFGIDIDCCFDTKLF